MAAILVTLNQARAHLRNPPAADNDDIQLKLNQAEDVIRRYLKDPVTTIESVSVAAAAEVMTTTPHGLTTGLTYTITNTQTTPTINGARVVTVTGLYTFTVPVTTTVGQSSALGWIGTPVWTPDTAPGNVTAAILLLLTSLYEHRGDDQRLSEDTWTAVERLLVGLRDPALA